MAIQAPCIVNAVNSANFFNFLEFKNPIQYKTAVIEDISKPVQHGNDFRYCGFKGEPFSLTAVVQCENQLIKSQYKATLAACTGRTYNIIDIYNINHGLFFLKGCKFSDEKPVYGWNSNQNYCGGNVILTVDMEFIPQ